MENFIATQTAIINKNNIDKIITRSVGENQYYITAIMKNNNTSMGIISGKREEINLTFIIDKERIEGEIKKIYSQMK